MTAEYKTDDRQDLYVALPSGERYYPAEGVIGLGSDLSLSSGYDQRDRRGDAVDDRRWPGVSWSREDKIAFADFMISEWGRYRQAVEATAPNKPVSVGGPENLVIIKKRNGAYQAVTIYDRYPAAVSDDRIAPGEVILVIGEDGRMYRAGSEMILTHKHL